jgi:hypothetical protein
MKIMSISASAAILATSLVGCGTQQSSQSPAPQKQQAPVAAKTIEADPSKDAALEAEYASLPANVILRVKKDSSGKEIPGSAEMVSLRSDVQQDQIAASFSKGQPLSEAKNGDDLDGDSSTQSWYGWNGYNGADYNNQTTVNYSNINYGNQYGSANFGAANGFGNDVGVNGGGAGWGVNQFSNGWNNFGSPYYGGFRPLVGSNVYQGAHWQYGRPWCYNGGNFNYYWYPRPRCGQWNFCR